MHAITRFSFPTTIIYGPGAIQELKKALDELSVKKPLVVTDSGFSKVPTYKTCLQVLEANGVAYEQYTNVQPNPHDTDVYEAAQVYVDNNCDAIIGIGGGSPMDAAKATAVLVVHGGKVEDYDVQQGGGAKITAVLPPIIAIPTTAGTGSEVGKCAVISSTIQGRKFMVCHPQMLPKRAILDPELTLSLPPNLTASTGMDALTHNIESLSSPEFHPLCDAIAYKGIQLAAKYLPLAVTQSDNIEARGFMMLSSMMGAIAFQKDLGACHSISHALSAVCGLPHGLANAVCLVPVMRFNLSCATEVYAQVAAGFGVNTFGKSDEESALLAIEQVVALNVAIGIPGSLRELGVTEDQFDEIVRIAFKDPCHLTNPKPCTAEDLAKILADAWKGYLL